MKKLTRMAALLMALLMVGVMFSVTALAVTTGTDLATDTDISEPTKAPDKKPAGTTTNKTNTNTYTATATEAPEEEAVELTFDVDAFLAALGIDAANVTVAGDTTTIVLDEAEGTYGGSVLVFVNGEMKVLILTSTYDASVIATFADWRKTITDVEALRAAEQFAEFVKNAECVLLAVLPELTADELDALLVAILNSDAENVEIEEEVLALFFGEDETGEVLGVYEQDGYQFCLFKTETSVGLSVRAL